MPTTEVYQPVARERAQASKKRFPLLLRLCQTSVRNGGEKAERKRKEVKFEKKTMERMQREDRERELRSKTTFPRKACSSEQHSQPWITTTMLEDSRPESTVENLRYKVVYRKEKKDWVAKPITETKSYDYLTPLVRKFIEARLDLARLGSARLGSAQLGSAQRPISPSKYNHCNIPETLHLYHDLQSMTLLLSTSHMSLIPFLYMNNLTCT